MAHTPPTAERPARSRLHLAPSLQGLVAAVAMARSSAARSVASDLASTTCAPVSSSGAGVAEPLSTPPAASSSAPASDSTPPTGPPPGSPIPSVPGRLPSTQPAPSPMPVRPAPHHHRVSASASSGVAAPSSEAPEEEERLRALAGRSAPALFSAARIHAKRGSGANSSLCREAQSDPEGHRRLLRSKTDPLSLAKLPPGSEPEHVDPAALAVHRATERKAFPATSDGGVHQSLPKSKGAFSSNSSLLNLLGKSEPRQEPRPIKKSMWSSSRLRHISGNLFRSRKASSNLPSDPPLPEKRQERRKQGTATPRPGSVSARSSTTTPRPDAIPQRYANPDPSLAPPAPASPAPSSGARSSLSLRSLLDGSPLEALRSRPTAHGTPGGKEEPGPASSVDRWEQTAEGPPHPEEAAEQQELLDNSSPSAPSTPSGWPFPRNGSATTWGRDKPADAGTPAAQSVDCLRHEEFGPLDAPAPINMGPTPARGSAASKLKQTGIRIRRMFSFESSSSSTPSVTAPQKDSTGKPVASRPSGPPAVQLSTPQQKNGPTVGQVPHPLQDGKPEQEGRLRTFSNMALRGKRRASPRPKPKNSKSAASSNGRTNSLTAPPTGLRAISLEMGFIDEANMNDPFRSYHTPSPADKHMKSPEAKKSTPPPSYPPKAGKSPRSGVSPALSRNSSQDTQRRTGSPRQVFQKRQPSGQGGALGTGTRPLICPPPNLPLPPLPGEPARPELFGHLLKPSTASGTDNDEGRPSSTDPIIVSSSASSFHSTTDLMHEGLTDDQRRIPAVRVKHATHSLATSEPSTPTQASTAQMVRSPERKASDSELPGAHHVRRSRLSESLILSQRGLDELSRNTSQASHSPSASLGTVDRESHGRTSTTRTSVMTRASSRRTSAAGLSWKSGSAPSRPTSLTTSSSRPASLRGIQAPSPGASSVGSRAQPPSASKSARALAQLSLPPTAVSLHEHDQADATPVLTPASPSGNASERESTKTAKPRGRSLSVEVQAGPLPPRSSTDSSYDSMSPPRPSSALSPLMDSTASEFHTPVHATAATRSISVILSGPTPETEPASPTMPITARAQRWSEQVLRSSRPSCDGVREEPLKSAPLLSSWASKHDAVPGPMADQTTVEVMTPRPGSLDDPLISPRNRVKSRSSTSTDTNSTHTVVPRSSHTLLRQQSGGTLGEA